MSMLGCRRRVCVRGRLTRRQADLDHRGHGMRRGQHRRRQRVARRRYRAGVRRVYAPSTLGIFLRDFSFGHASQVAAVARAHLVALAARTALLPGIAQRAFVDIDSLLRSVYGHAKQGRRSGTPRSQIRRTPLCRSVMPPGSISRARSSGISSRSRVPTGHGIHPERRRPGRGILRRPGGGPRRQPCFPHRHARFPARAGPAPRIRRTPL